jgi:ferritin-like metal-binding protein YciE
VRALPVKKQDGTAQLKVPGMAFAISRGGFPHPQPARRRGREHHYAQKEAASMKLASLEDLLVEQLKDLYSAENQLVKALPRMAKAAENEDLRQGFLEHLEQTRTHVERLEQACDMLGVRPKGKKCAGMEGLVHEGKEIMEEDAEPSVLDAGLIAAAQKVEHYEMASYGCARTWARQLGQEGIAALLDETFEEEKATDEKLTQLAEQLVNEQAADADDEEEVEANGNGRSRSVGRRKSGARR